MPKSVIETLESFLQRQPVATLAAVLIELAEEHEAVQRRLARLQLADRPDKLAAAFKKTLAGWRRSKRFYDYRESRAFGRELEAWLDQIARELVPKDPPAAVSLFENFIEADASWFERADDSDGSIGDAVRSACRHWLEAAARCETPPSVWRERLMALADADEYGAREALLRHADLLLQKSALTEMATLYQSRLAEVLRGAGGEGRLPHEVFKMLAALSLLSEALHEPDVKVRAVLMVSPDPNAQQLTDFVRSYLDVNRPEDALVWLARPWGSENSSQQSLQAEALGQLGRFDESAPIRQKMFERSLAVYDFQRWLEHLPEAAHADAVSTARHLALEHKDAISAAALLIEIGDAGSAEGRLLDARARIDGNNYPQLVPLAKAQREQDCPRGEAVVYRALLYGILDRANARAYGHAAQYWHRLREIANSCSDLVPLEPHASFEADIRGRHPRKAAFWASVNRQPNGNFAEIDDIRDN